METTQERVVALINEAQLVSKDKKLECLNQVNELILHKDPSLLDSFFEEVVAFQQDTSVDVRKLVIGFIENACKRDSYLMTPSLPKLRYLLINDFNVNILKRVIICCIQLYKIGLAHLVKMKIADNESSDMWENLNEIKRGILSHLDGENEGVRTLVIKFIEIVILSQSKKEKLSELPRGNEVDFSLDMVPLSHPVLKIDELKEEAGMLLGQLLDLTTSPNITSANLITCITGLCNIAKQRPLHIVTVIQSLELLQANLPINFSLIQINSVTKNLKTQLLGILRLPSSFECRAELVTLLTALGCSQSEINKNTPKDSGSSNKRSRHDAEGSTSKRPRVDEGKEESTMRGNKLMEAIDMTTSDLKPLLTVEAVTELVIQSMNNLPDSIPKTFRHSYTPIAAAGTEAQVTQVARLLASQMTSAGIGVGAQDKGIKRDREGVNNDPRVKSHQDPIVDEEIKHEHQEEINLEESIAELTYLGCLLGLPDIMDPLFPLAYSSFFGTLPPLPTTAASTSTTSDANVHTDNLISISSKEEEMKDESDSNKSGKRRAGPLPPQKLKKIKMFDLSAVVKPMEGEEKERLSVEAFRRILTAGKVASHGINSSQVHSRLVIHLVTQYGGEFNRTLLQHILDDFKSHFELALMWLYAEYCIGEQLIVTPANTLRYDDCLISLMKGAKSKLEPRDRLFTRLMLECPLVTSNAIEIIRDYCKEEERVLVGVGTLKELIIKRSQGSGEFLESLLEMTMSELEQARLQSLHTIKRLYETKPNLSQRIEKFAVKTLQKLLSDHPSFYYDSDIEVASEWSEESVKMCVGLFLLLLPVNSQLVKELAIVYTNTLPAVKRIILKLLDQPVRSIGMGSPELLELVENCPTGAETLIMRILYILTEKAAPSAELVNRVRELYQRNSSDVRFLIPVLHGLQKSEVIAALPQFIRLSPNVVKGVFERLLMSYKGEGSITMSPVSPSELLIALHNIECRGDEPLIKAIIRATSLCFSEKSVYTQEVLAVVLQQLVEQTPIPILMMRTVLQSLAICPRLVNFVLTLLTKLISKQIWKQPKVWQGFIKCCEQLKPHSFQVLLQLPPHQLEAVLKVSQSLRHPFVSHVNGLTPTQRAAVPKSILEIIDGWNNNI